MQPPQKRRRTDETDAGTETDPALQTRHSSISASEVSNYNSLHASSTSQYVTPRMESRSQADLVSRIHQIVGPEDGIKLFVRYVTVLSPHMPAVVFPPDTTAEQVRKERPILYSCILTAASTGILPREVCSDLARETIRTIADCVVCNGAKSLELIQALQVTALWYKPPEKPVQTNFYQIIHMAAVMAIDIGLGKRFHGVKGRHAIDVSNAENKFGVLVLAPQNSDTPEARRAWLGCYYLCARWVTALNPLGEIR